MWTFLVVSLDERIKDRRGDQQQDPFDHCSSLLETDRDSSDERRQYRKKKKDCAGTRQQTPQANTTHIFRRSTHSLRTTPHSLL